MPKPFDPALLRVVPATRWPVAALAAMGILSGIATVAMSFALAALVVATVGSVGLTAGVAGGGSTGAAGSVGASAAWLAALFLARAVLAAASDLVAAWAGVTVSTGLRAALLRRWGSVGATDRPERGVAVTLATAGASAVEPYAARYLPTLVGATIVPVLAIGTLAVVDWPSAVIVVLTVPLLPIFAALIGHATAESSQRRWAALSALSGHFLDVVRGLPTLVSYGRAERQIDTVREVSERHRRATMQTLRIAFLSSAALELVATISVALVAVTVGIRLADGTMGLEHALVAILLAPEAYWPIRRVGAEFHAAADGAAALEDLLVQLKPDDAEALPQEAAPPAAVRLRGVTFTYAAGLAPVVRDLDLEAGTHDTAGLTVITGASGVGKTTVLDLIAGLRTPTAGTIEAPASHYVTQRPFLAAGTIREALTIGVQAPDPELWVALGIVGLDRVVAFLPDALDSRLGDDGFGLSAGQRQRLALARACLSTDPLLLVDEPTAHLDGDAARRAGDLVASLSARRTVVVVTHDPSLVARADHHVHLVAWFTPSPAANSDSYFDGRSDRDGDSSGVSDVDGGGNGQSAGPPRLLASAEVAS